MIVNKLKVSESENVPITIPEYDQESLQYLLEKYGEDSVSNAINEYDSYYPDSRNFNKTGGSITKGLKGLVRSIPSFLITTAISWPVALLAGVGALQHRMQKKWDDKHSFINRFRPSYWTEYIANPSSSKTENRREDGGETFGDKAKRFLGLGGAAAAGAIAGSKLANKNIDDIKNEAFKTYWITLSNGEIIRLRADNEENAKMFANYIIEQTKPVYEKLNQKIKEYNAPRFKFNFTDGEVCYWAGPEDKKQAYQEALKSRQELADVLNKQYAGLIVLDSLERPQITGKVEVKKGELIEYPKVNVFKNITTTQPVVADDTNTKKLGKPVYRFKMFDNCRIIWKNFKFNIPSTKIGQAEEFIKGFAKNDELLKKLEDNIMRTETLYKVTMPDGDSYDLAAVSSYEAAAMAIKIYNIKVLLLKKILATDEKNAYENFLNDFEDVLSRTKSVRLINNYNKDIFKRDYATAVVINDKDEPKETPVKIKMS